MTNQFPDSAQKDTQNPSRLPLIRLIAGGVALVLVLAGLVYISKRPAATPEPIPSTVSSSTQTTTDLSSGPCTGSDAYTLQGDTVFYHTHTGLCVPIKDVDLPSFAGLSKQYAKDKDHVYFFEDDYPTTPITIIQKADPSTFTLYDVADITSGLPLAKDAEHIYIGSNIFFGADPKTFAYVGTGGEEFACAPYYKDATHIFMNGEIVERADPATFRYISQTDIPPNYFQSPCLAIDKENVYLDEKRIQNADPKTIKVLGSYLIDKRAVYFDVNELKGSDPKTFVTVDDNSAVGKDASTMYECGQAIVPNHSTSELLGEYYGKYSDVVYYKGKALIGADAKSFKVLGGSGTFSCESSIGGYAKDGIHAYYDGRIIEGADAKSFELRTENHVGYDHQNEYINGVKVPSDFTSCSTDISDLPGGFTAWQSKLPQFQNSTSTTDFQICLLPNKEKLIGYKPDPNDNAKNIYWFDKDNALIRSTNFTCGYGEDPFPQRFRALNGSKLTISCLVSDACTGRTFYTLDLNAWRSSNSSTFVTTDEHYDCGYRG